MIESPSKIDTYGNSGAKLEHSSFKGEIEFKDVAFKYPGEDSRMILENFNLKMEAGK